MRQFRDGASSVFTGRSGGMTMKNAVIAAIVAGLSCVFAQGSAQALGISFVFASVDPGIHGDGVTTLAATAVAGEYLITKITGSVTDNQLNPTTYSFTGLVPVGGYASNNNIIFLPPKTSGGITTPGFTDYFGDAYTTAAGVDFNFAAQSMTGQYVLVLNNSFQNPDGNRGVPGSDVIVVTNATIVPELSTWAMLCLGFVGIGLAGAVSHRRFAL
jgi:hypothetical protein